MSDCYKAACEWVLSNKEYTLVHGIPTLTGGDYAGEQYGHAWCELDDGVYDAASGQDVPKNIYYSVGNIDYTVRYTSEEARENILEYGTWGAWDDTIILALHN